MGESEYIQQQTDDARAAIRTTIDELESDVGRAINPRVWVRAHPWMTLAAAAAAGFVASQLFTREEEPQTEHPAPHPQETSHSQTENGHPARRWSRLIPILTKTVATAWSIFNSLQEAQKAHFPPVQPPRQPPHPNSR